MRINRLISPRDNELILYNALKRVTGVPAQTGHAGEFLYTDGTNSSWMALAGGGDMLAVNNLSDVVSASTSLTNIGGLAVANNLSDVADAETANNNLGQNDESYTPTITVWGGAATTVVVDGLAQAILINDNSVTVMVKFNVSFDAAEDIVESSFTLPPSFLPTNNFAAKSNVLASVAVYNEGAFDGTSFGFAVFAYVGSKECYLNINTDTAGSSGSLVVIFRYNKNN